MTAKKFLQQVEKLDVLIKNKMIEKQQWEEIAQGITAQMGGEKVQTSGNQQKMAAAIDKYIDIEREIEESIIMLYAKRREVLEVIEQLDAEEYDFLHQVYIQHIQLIDIAEAKQQSYSWATTLHGRALASVQKILNERKY